MVAVLTRLPMARSVSTAGSTLPSGMENARVWSGFSEMSVRSATAMPMCTNSPLYEEAFSLLLSFVSRAPLVTKPTLVDVPGNGEGNAMRHQNGGSGKTNDSLGRRLGGVACPRGAAHPAGRPTDDGAVVSSALHPPARTSTLMRSLLRTATGAAHAIPR